MWIKTDLGNTPSGTQILKHVHPFLCHPENFLLQKICHSCSGKKITTQPFASRSLEDENLIYCKRKPAFSHTVLIHHWAEHQVRDEHHIRHTIRRSPFTEPCQTFLFIYLFHASAVLGAWCMKVSLSWNLSWWGRGMCSSNEALPLKTKKWDNRSARNRGESASVCMLWTESTDRCRLMQLHRRLRVTAKWTCDSLQEMCE